MYTCLFYKEKNKQKKKECYSKVCLISLETTPAHVLYGMLGIEKLSKIGMCGLVVEYNTWVGVVY
jgi:hypothetical protein